MNPCEWLEQLLAVTPSVDALAHAKSCAECGPARAAWDAMNGPAAPAASLDAIAERVRAELKAHPRAGKWWADALVMLAVNVSVAAGGVAVMGMKLIEPGVSSWGIGAALLALMGVGAWAAVRPGAHVLRVCVLAIAAGGALWAALGGSGVGPDRPFSAGLACALTESGMSLLPLIAVLWVTSRFAFDLARAAVGGLSVGATGLLVLHLHCTNGTPAHLVTFHLLPWMVVAFAAVVVRRMLPSRSFAP